MVISNLARPPAPLSASLDFLACHNLAEAAARALGSLPEFTALKAAILSKLLEESAMRKVLSELPSLSSAWRG